MKALLTRGTAVATFAMAIDQLTKVLARETLALCTARTGRSGAIAPDSSDLPS